MKNSDFFRYKINGQVFTFDQIMEANGNDGDLGHILHNLKPGQSWSDGNGGEEIYRCQDAARCNEDFRATFSDGTVQAVSAYTAHEARLYFVAEFCKDGDGNPTGITITDLARTSNFNGFVSTNKIPSPKVLK